MEGNKFEVSDQDDRGKVAWRLRKSLYGLTQFGRLLAELLHKTFEQVGIAQCRTVSCMHGRRLDSETMKVGVYLEDLLMTGTKTTMINQFFKDMHALEVKNFGVVAKFLGIRVTYDPEIG